MTVRDNDQASGLSDDNARLDATEMPPVTASPEPAAQAAPAEPIDRDLAELRAAEAAAEAEERAAAGGQQQQAGDTQQAAQQPQQQEATGTPPAQQPRPKAVPLERFNEVNRAKAEAERRVAYLEGALAATRGGTTGTAPAEAGQPATQAPAPAADPITAEIRQQRALLKDIAGRFDRGEITLAEVEEARGQAEDRIAELNLERVQSIQQGRQPDSLADQAIEQTHLNTLYARHPYAANLTEQQATLLMNMAQANLAMTGKPIRDGSKAETLRLREEVAKLSDTFGPQWGVQRSQSATPGTNQQPPTTRPQQGLSPAAAARSAKMDLAAALPPDPAGFGQGAPADLTDAQIATMSDEDIAALPAHVQHRLLHATG